jgi:hypothetical protein
VKSKKEENQWRLWLLFAMLVSWAISKERIACMFRNYFSTSVMLIMKFKEEAAMWTLAGRKCLVLSLVFYFIISPWFRPKRGL